MKWILLVVTCGWSSCEKQDMGVFSTKADCLAAAEQFTKYHYTVCSEKQTDQPTN